MTAPRATLPLACALLLSLVGCEAYPDFVYEPRPASRRLDAEQQPLRVLASVMGIREPSGEQQPYVDVRLRVENEGDLPARLDPQELSLVSADLLRLELLSSDPPGVLEVPPQSVATWQTRFALPADPDEGPDLSGLSLRWTVQIGDRAYSRDMRFRGSLPYYYGYYPYDPWYGDYWYGPYWGSGWRVHSGVGWGF